MRTLPVSPERLEPRIAPALLVAGGKAVVYTDADGDLVTIRTTKGVFQDPAAAGQTQFTFGPTGTGIGEQLRVLNLAGSPAFDGASISITAAPFDFDNDNDLDGDGLVNVGYIRARDFPGSVGVDLGSVIVRGDLGAIDAGDNFADPALGSLNVLSLGVEGLTTGAPDLVSDFLGGVGSIRVAGDVMQASLGIFGTLEGGQVIGNIGTVTIGGSLIGGAAANSGVVFAEGSIAIVKIGSGIFGGGGAFSGLVRAATLGSVTVEGPIGGGDGATSGGISVERTIGKLTVGGSVFGGSGPDSGRISAQKFASVTIGGSVIGGEAIDATLTAESSGLIFAFKPAQGAIPGAGTLGPVKIGGSLLGGSGGGSGAIAASVAGGSVTISGTIEGGSGAFSGVLSGPTLGPVKVFGSVFGGTGNNSGAIVADTQLKGVDISGSLVGGTNDATGTIRAGGTVGLIRIAGSIIGDDGEGSGAIFSQTSANFTAISIDGNIEGGEGVGSGGIFTGGSALSIRVGGSVFGGDASGTGLIRIDGVLAALTIGGDLVGGDADNVFVADSGYVVARQMGAVTVGGTIFAGEAEGANGALVNSGAIRAVFDISSLTVRGGLQGSSTNPVIISAGGVQTPGTTDLAFKTIRINGGAFNAKILAGYSPVTTESYLGQGVNADAQIGSIVVGADWVASDIIAGLVPGAGGYFGDANDAKISGTGVRDRAGIVSKISSIIIGGRAFGTREATSDFHSGIGAEHLVSLKVGGTSVIPLLPGPKNDTFAAGKAHAVGGTRGTGAGDGFDMHAYEV